MKINYEYVLKGEEEFWVYAEFEKRVFAKEPKQTLLAYDVKEHAEKELVKKYSLGKLLDGPNYISNFNERSKGCWKFEIQKKEVKKPKPKIKSKTKEA